MKTLAITLIYALSAGLLPARTFCSDYKATREYFHQFCDYVAAEKRDVKYIFIGGYYMRDLVAGYRIFGEKRYLDTAIAYADGLLAKQSPRGYWQTGYSRVYLADTGSALGLFIVLYDHVDKERQRKYFEAIQRYVDAIERDGLIRPSGALDVGMLLDTNGMPTVAYGEDYTVSSALTGGEVFTWMYHLTKKEKYRQIACNTQRWVLSTMRDDGVIPYNHPTGHSDLSKKGDPRNDHMLWTNSLYLTSAYVGEGLLSFDLYCGKRAWQQEVRAKIKPHIDYVLKTQNPDGTWAAPGPWDQKRSPGIINLLTWYYRYVEKDRRIPAAIGRFEAFLLVPQNARNFGLLNAGAAPLPKEQASFDCVTSLTGRALADMIEPGVDAKW
jgi:hypothetical protein